MDFVNLLCESLLILLADKITVALFSELFHLRHLLFLDFEVFKGVVAAATTSHISHITFCFKKL